jgi:hypothetical protein
VQHDDGFALARIIEVDAEVGETFFVDGDEFARRAFAEFCHGYSLKMLKNAVQRWPRTDLWPHMAVRLWRTTVQEESTVRGPQPNSTSIMGDGVSA